MEVAIMPSMAGRATDGGDGGWLQDVATFIIFIFPSLTLVTVGLRIYARLGKKQFGLDDALVCLAMTLTVAHTGCMYMSLKKMFIGIHASYIPAGADLETGIIWNYATQLIYNPILAIAKCSVLVFLLRLGGHRRRIRRSIYALLTWTILQMVATFIVVVFQCKPISYFWTRAGAQFGSGVCIDTASFYVATGALTILTDILVLALPFWVFLGLQMAKKTKVALIGIFVMGGVVTVISILRMIWLIDVDFKPLTPDYTYDIRFVYSQIEVCLAIATASAPALRPVVARWFPSLFSGSGKSGTPGYYPENPYGQYGGKSATGVSVSRGGGGVGGGGMGTGGKVSTAARNAFPLSNMSGRPRAGRDRSEIPGQSPTSSEEEIMTYHGIMRKTDITVQIDEPSSTGGSSRSSGRKNEVTTTVGQAV